MLAVPAARADISASFANAGPVDSGTFRTAANPAGNDTITLDYTIDGAGAVSLDASTTNTNATFINLVNQFDRPGGTAGSTPNSGVFNASFSLKIISGVGSRSLTNNPVRFEHLARLRGVGCSRPLLSHSGPVTPSWRGSGQVSHFDETTLLTT